MNGSEAGARPLVLGEIGPLKGSKVGAKLLVLGEACLLKGSNAGARPLVLGEIGPLNELLVGAKPPVLGERFQLAAETLGTVDMALNGLGAKLPGAAKLPAWGMNWLLPVAAKGEPDIFPCCCRLSVRVRFQGAAPLGGNDFTGVGNRRFRKMMYPGIKRKPITAILDSPSTRYI